MKKKAIKIATSTAIAATAFVAGAPVNQADAAVNVDQLVTDAQNAGTVLKWAISVEGSADYVTKPMDQYNAAKKAIANAEAALKGLSFSDKLKFEAKLTDPKIQVTRAMAYIDAITSSDKIKGLTSDLNAAVASGDLDKVEAAYHNATAEYRKQAKLLDRVYGQSTRDGIRNAVKPALEKLVADLKNDVTVHMLAREAADLAKADKLVEAAQKLADAQAILDASVLKWEADLQKSVNDVAESIPLTVTSVTRVDKTTVQVKFTKALEVAPVTHFTFDKGLTVTSTKLSEDGRTVTLTTSTQADDTTYTLAYKGEDVKSFTTPKAGASKDPITGSTDEVRLDIGQYRTLTFNLKDSDGKPYYGDVEVALTVADILNIVTINGVTVDSSAVTPVQATTTKDGVLTVVVKAEDVGNAALKITNLKSGEDLTSGKTIVIADIAGEYTGKSVLSVNTDKDYFTAAEDTSGDENKISFKKTDLFQVEGKVVSYDEFKKALTKHAIITVDYDPDNTTNFFNITEVVDIKVLSITNPNRADKTVRVNPAAGQEYYDLKGTGEAGKVIKVFVDGSTTASYDTKVASNGTWEVRVYLNANKENTFTVGQYHSKTDTTPIYVTETATIWEGAFVVNGDVVNATSTGELNFGEELTFTFSTIDKVVSADDYEDKATFASNSKLTFIDAKGEKLEFQVGKEDTKVKSGTNGTNEVTIILGAPIKANDKFDHTSTIKLHSLTGVTNQVGLSLTNGTFNTLN